MIAYSTTDIARGVARAKRDGIRLRETGYRLRYRSTGSEDPAGAYRYEQRLNEELTAADCTCASINTCKHGAAAISAARKAEARRAARTMRRYQVWQGQVAAIAA